MAVPVITSITFDKSFYTHGQTINATVVYTTSNTFFGPTLTVTVTDELTGETSANNTNAQAGFNVQGTAQNPGPSPDPTLVSGSDNRVPPGSWTQISNTPSGPANNTTWTAVLQSVA